MGELKGKHYALNGNAIMLFDLMGARRPSWNSWLLGFPISGFHGDERGYMG